MTGRIVDSYANINLVKLFARKNYEQLGAADSLMILTLDGLK